MSPSQNKKAIAENVPTDKLTKDYFLREGYNNFINTWETRFKFNGFIGGGKIHNDSFQAKVEKLYSSLDPDTKY